MKWGRFWVKVSIIDFHIKRVVFGYFSVKKLDFFLKCFTCILREKNLFFKLKNVPKKPFQYIFKVNLFFCFWKKICFTDNRPAPSNYRSSKGDIPWFMKKKKIASHSCLKSSITISLSSQKGAKYTYHPVYWHYSPCPLYSPYP